MKRGPAILLAHLLAACDSTLVARIPFDPGTQSMIIAVERGASLEVHALDVQAAHGMALMPFQLHTSGDEALALTVLSYDVDLASLEIAPGLLARADKSEPSRPLPSAPHRYSATLRGGDLSAWTELPALTGELAAFTIPKPPERSACDGITATAVPSPNETGFMRVGLSSRDRALAIKARLEAQAYAIGRTGAAEPIDIPGVSTASDLISDHRGTHYLAAFDTRVFELDDQGATTAVRELPFVASHVTVDAAGTAFAYNAFESAELVQSSTRAVAGPAFPATIVQWVIVSRERMAATTPQRIYVFERGAWSEEAQGSELDRGMLFGDAESFGFVHPGLGVLLRDEATHVWRQISDPSPGTNLYSGHMLGRGRVLIAGDGGSAFIYAKDAWCTIETGTIRALAALDYVPELSTLIAMSNDSNSTQVAVWFDLPSDFR